MAIAIVDDTPLNLTLIQALVRKLTPPETELVTFSQPLEGLQWCASNEPDLLIVDYIYFMNGGRVVAEGPPDEIRHTKDPFVHQFVHAEADGPVPFHYPAGDYAQALIGGRA